MGIMPQQLEIVTCMQKNQDEIKMQSSKKADVRAFLRDIKVTDDMILGT
jgi:hypothetical protein